MNVKTLLLSLAAAASFTATAADWDVLSVQPSPENVIKYHDVLDSVMIQFANGWDFTCSSTLGYATFTNQETGEVLRSTSFEFNEMYKDWLGYSYLQINLPLVTENGTYVLNIPAGAMIHGTSTSPELTYTYTINDPKLEQTEEVPECQLISATPEADTALDFLGTDEGREYTFDTNINKYVGYAEADWHDVTDNPEEPEWISSTYCSHTVGDTAPIVFTSYNTYDPLYAGHDYRMTVYLYDQEAKPNNQIGTFTVMYKGATSAYEYSDITATSVSPDPATYLIEDASEAHFTVSFSGAVEIDTAASNISHGPAGVVPYTSITANDDKTEWTFVIPEAELKERVVNCFILAKDSEGRTVLGNEDLEEYQSGEGEAAGFMFTYESAIAGATLVVTPAAGTVEELKSFTVTSEKGFPYMDPSWTAYPYLMKDKELIYTFNLESDVDMSEYDKIVMTIPDDKVPTENGRYQLVFPYGCFMFLQSEWDQGGTASKYLVVSYTLGEEPQGNVIYDLMPASVTPSAEQVAEIKNVDIHYADDVELVLYDAYILDADGNQVAKADINFDDDFDNLTDYHVTFDPAITAVGTYTFYVPEGTFGDTSYAMNGRGHANADIRVTYVIQDTAVAAPQADTLAGDVYSVTGVCVLRNATAADIKALDKGIYVVNGKKVVVL